MPNSTNYSTPAKISTSFTPVSRQSTNHAQVAKQSTDFGKAQLTAGTAKIYDNTGAYDDALYYDGIIVLSETEDGATNFAEISKNSTNFSIPT